MAEKVSCFGYLVGFRIKQLHVELNLDHKLLCWLLYHVYVLGFLCTLGFALLLHYST